MDRRLVITPRRPAPHEFVKGPIPGVCAKCPLPKANKQVHVDDSDPRLAEQRQAQEEHLRRIGDQL